MKNFFLPFSAMILVVAISNFLVQFPLNDWLTWGAFTYPISFFITELTNRYCGPEKARKVVYAGFIFGAIVSIWIASPKIALASNLAFLFSQLLDIRIFTRFRNANWWCAPFYASFFASLIDSMIFWNIAFFGEELPIFTWALGDTSIKFLVDAFMLIPFRLAIQKNRFVKNI